MKEALKIAIEEFRNSHSSGVPRKIQYLNRCFMIDPDTAEAIYLEGKEKGAEREKMIILHYLTGEKETALSGKLIDFRDIPGGNMYYPVFESRVYAPFVGCFGERPELFVEAASSLGGERVDYGDIAFRFMVLPQIPVSFIFHRGDEEFSPACKVLFDSSISDHCPVEDIAAICEDTVRELRACSPKL